MKQLLRPITKTLLFNLIVIAGLAAFTACNGELEEPEPDPGGVITLAKCLSTANTPVNNEFSNPTEVTITGYTGHAMEPFVTRENPNPTYLFFNNLNDGINTSLHYATRVNDTTFTYQGTISGVNGTPPHLDAVASMDTANNFFYISTRNYPASFQNVYTGTFGAGTVTGLTEQPGNFYIETPGWLIMDAEISPDGNDLYYVNAHFSGGAVPDLSTIGIAHKSAGSFLVDANNTELMKNVNSDWHLEYAPCISNDGLELFYTRLNLCNLSVEILVSKRSSTTESFGLPQRIGVISGFVEAPTLTFNGTRLYYHKKVGDIHKIFMVSR